MLDAVAQAANRAMCRQCAALLFSVARSLPPPEGEELAAVITASCCVIEEIVARSPEGMPIVVWRGESVSEGAIRELFHATAWALVALRVFERREDDESLTISCAHLVGDLDDDLDFGEDISRVMNAGGADFLALRLHARYLRILDCRSVDDIGFIPLLPLLMAAYRQLKAG